MSSVKLNHALGGSTTLEAGDTASAETVTLPAGNNTLATETQFKAAGGRKNLIINGGMQVAQRGTSASSVASVQYASLDRIKFGISQLGEYTVSQSSDAPDGFGSSMKIDCTTADASPASGNRLHFFTLLEGQDVQSLKKGSASAESVTLSFWVKCTKTGDIQVNLQDNDNTRLIGNTVTINATDTWEYKTITYAGDTTGAFGNDTGDSLQIDWWLDSGSTYNSGAVPTSWEAYAAGDRAAGETLAFGDSTANDFYITGIQLELGDTATDFEHRSYGEELALCQRYYQKWNSTNFAGRAAGTTRVVFGVPLSTPLRASPTVYDDTNQWNCYNSAGRTVMYTQDCAVNQYTVGTNSLLAQVTNFSGLTDDDGYSVGNSGSFALDAEL